MQFSYLKFTLIVILFSVFLTNCKKDDDNIPSSSLSCEIDGNAFVSPDSLAFAEVSDYKIIIYGYKNSSSNSSLIRLEIPEDFKTGTLTMAGPLINRRAEYSFAGQLYSTAYGIGEGTFEILKHTKTRIKGTFHFKAGHFMNIASVLDVTKGEFDVQIE